VSSVNNSKNEPLFIIGTERSGSNLLRAILNSHTNISIPHPPHIMKDMGPLVDQPISRYKNLSIDQNFYRLIDDVIKLVNMHFAPWPTKINRETIFKQAINRSLYAINAEIYQDYLNYTGKKRWGCKSTFMIHYIDQILKIHPRAHFIHLVRDGRDVAVSARHSVFNHYHPYYVAKLWAREQALALNWKEKLPASQFTTIRYEDLTSNPEQTIKNLCFRLDEDYQEEMLRYSEKTEVQILAKMSQSWSNISRSILSDNSQKYKIELSSKDIFLFETIAHRELMAFDYLLETQQKNLINIKISLHKKIQYYLIEKLAMLRVELNASINDKNFILRWKKRFYVWRLHD
jgi:hypothetical protein